MEAPAVADLMVMDTFPAGFATEIKLRNDFLHAGSTIGFRRTQVVRSILSIPIRTMCRSMTSRMLFRTCAGSLVTLVNFTVSRSIQS